MSGQLEEDDLAAVTDPNVLADEAAKSLQGVLEEAGISGDVLRNVVDKVRQRGRGGRTPAGDPRLDPNIEPKKAKRILANRLSAAKSKMRQRVLTESLEMLKAKSGNAGQQPTTSSSQRGQQSPEDMEDVRDMVLDLQERNRELEARVSMLEAQMAVWAASSMHPMQVNGPMRVVPVGYPPDSGAMLAVLNAAAAAGPSAAGMPQRGPAPGGAGAGSAAAAAAAAPGPSSAFSNYINPNPRPRSTTPHRTSSLDPQARDSSPAPPSWVVDYGGLGLGQLMMPRLAMPVHAASFPRHLYEQQPSKTEGQSHEP